MEGLQAILVQAVINAAHCAKILNNICIRETAEIASCHGTKQLPQYVKALCRDTREDETTACKERVTEASNLAPGIVQLIEIALYIGMPRAEIPRGLFLPTVSTIWERARNKTPRHPPRDSATRAVRHRKNVRPQPAWLQEQCNAPNSSHKTITCAPPNPGSRSFHKRTNTTTPTPEPLCACKTGRRETPGTHPKWSSRSSLSIAVAVEFSIPSGEVVRACGAMSARARAEPCAAESEWQSERGSLQKIVDGCPRVFQPVPALCGRRSWTLLRHHMAGLPGCSILRRPVPGTVWAQHRLVRPGSKSAYITLCLMTKE
jgi:hypothetical protein